MLLKDGNTSDSITSLASFWIPRIAEDSVSKQNWFRSLSILLQDLLYNLLYVAKFLNL
jgi:hypothetical protein